MNQQNMWTSITICSDFQQLSIPRDEVASQLEQKGWEFSSIQEVKLILDELLTNAIRHGNKSDLKKEVTLRYKLTENTLTVEVEDHGEGPLPERLEDQTLPAVDSLSGRGLFLVKRITDSLAFEGGTVIFSKTNGKDYF
jgi:serine/threonine-protein kinase RsbW